MNVGFEKSEGHDEWLTPPAIVHALGEFDLDPCAPENPPWTLAKHSYTKTDDGLSKQWFGRVFCNPPYGTATGKWLERCAQHGNAIALVFARTETQMFFDYVWSKASAILFIEGRLRFYFITGQKAGGAGSPSVLIAYNDEAAEALERSTIRGKFIRLTPAGHVP